MTTDHDKLRELAEAARDAWDNYNAGRPVIPRAADKATECLRDFVDEDLILSLLDRLDRAERERDEERAQHAVASHEAHKTAVALWLALDEACAERDARPKITPEDAAAWCIDGTSGESGARILLALRAHARKAAKP